jgi:hypothetical protein
MPAVSASAPLAFSAATSHYRGRTVTGGYELEPEAFAVR